MTQGAGARAMAALLFASFVVALAYGMAWTVPLAPSVKSLIPGLNRIVHCAM
jgi:hypothetical protein